MSISQNQSEVSSDLDEQGSSADLQECKQQDGAEEAGEGKSAAQRKIIHIDADFFFAALEVRDNPSLKGKPIAVGGSSTGRGVISTCSYEARVYGVRSAMASAYALRLCPHLILLPSRFDVYRKASQQMMEIFEEYTDTLQSLSLDEAFLDVSESSLCQGSATLIAKEIRDKVYREVGITVSAGVAPVKFLAKVASEVNKPDGLCVIRPEQVDGFTAKLAVSALPGVGKVTEEKLKRLGIIQCSDIRGKGVEWMCEHLGSYGQKLHDMAYGIDQRQVKSREFRKSLSVEKTYREDLPNLKEVFQALENLLPKFNERLANYRARKGFDKTQIGSRFIKIKYYDFESCGMESSIGEVEKSRLDKGFHKDDFALLFGKLYQKRQAPVRLIGIGVRFRDPDKPLQFEIDPL